MKTKWTFFLIAGLFALTPATTLAGGLHRSLVVSNLSGNMHLFQPAPAPCPPLERDVPVLGGQFGLAPVQSPDAVGGAKRFVLTQGLVRVSPFTVDYSCLGHDEHHDYTALSMEVAKAVSFLAYPVAEGSPVYTFDIPPRDVLLHEAAIKNGAPEAGYTHPRRVTGSIDLDTGNVTLLVVVGMRIHASVLGDFAGSLTTNVTGTIRFPDTDRDGVPDRTDNCPLTANPGQGTVASPLIRAPHDVTLHSCQDTRIGRPLAVDLCDGRPVTTSNDAPHPFPLGSTVVTWSAQDSDGHLRADTQTVTIEDQVPPEVSCLPGTNPNGGGGPGGLFRVFASDQCQGVTLRLGSYVLGMGETIKITQTGQPGVRLVNVMPGNIRHFAVGRGESVIVAADGSGNTATAICH